MSEENYWTSWMRRRVRRRRFLQGAALGGVGLAAAGLIGCDEGEKPTAKPAPASGTPTPVAPGSLPVVKIGIANDAQSGDGAITGGGSWPVTAYVYNNLVMTSEITGGFVKALASNYKALDPEGKVWEFEIRKGVKFHNGDELTAEDILFTTERQKDPEVKATRAAEVARVIEKVEAIEPYKVRYTLKQPDATFPSFVWNDYVVPKKYAQQVGVAGFAAKPVGTGPFMLKSREINYRIVYETFKDHWNTDRTNGIPYTASVSGAEIRVLPESETRISALLAGEVDAIVNVPSSAVKRLESEKGISLQFGETGQPIGILINSQAEKTPSGAPNPYRDKRVRQALNYAIDLDKIIKTTLTGREKPNTGVNDRGLGADTSLKPYPYDPAKAKSLLEQAGYGSGIKEEDAVIFNPGDRWPQSRDVCEAVAGYLRNVGVKSSVQDLEYATAAAMLNQKKVFPMCLWGQGANPETMGQVELVMVNPGVRGEYMGNPKIVSLYAQAKKTVDETERGKIYAEIQRTFFEDAGHIFLYSAMYCYATRAPWQWEAGIPRSGEIPIWRITRA